MTRTSLPLLAGIASTAIFAGGTLPMLGKAWRTRDLSSYSLGSLLMANLGNAVYAVYVVSLPVGPVWLLHAFNMATTALMLTWYLRYGRTSARSVESELRRLERDGAPVGQVELGEHGRDVMVGRLG